MSYVAQHELLGEADEAPLPPDVTATPEESALFHRIKKTNVKRWFSCTMSYKSKLLLTKEMTPADETLNHLKPKPVVCPLNVKHMSSF